MDNEKEISFGAFDSELMHQEIFIPEGFTATIEGDKIILKKTESEDERIRKALIEYFNEQCDMSDWNGVYGYQAIAWLEKQGQPKPPMQNGIIINGVEYEFVEDHESDECERCALKELCKSKEEGNVLCIYLFTESVATNHRFEKKTK